MHQNIPKQFIHVNDKPVIIYTLEAFQNHADIDVVAAVCIDGWQSVLSAYGEQFNITKLKHIIPGGDNGQSSIRNGIFYLGKYYDGEDIVLIHDAIRPLVSGDIISDCIRVASLHGSAVTCIPCAEAMLHTDNQVSSERSLPRENLKRTQTPQAARLKTLVELHKEALKKGVTNSIATCTLMIELGKTVYFSKGSEKNIKLTTVDDIDIFKALLIAEQSDWLKR